MSDRPLCAICKIKPASHETWNDPEHGHFHQCCECYVKAGGSPADWHPECMRTYDAMKPKSATPPSI